MEGPASKKAKIQQEKIIECQSGQPAESSTASSSKTMQIFVKTTIKGDKLIALDVESTDTIDKVVAQIHQKLGIPCEMIDLKFGDWRLEEMRLDVTLEGNDICDQSVLEMREKVLVHVRSASGDLIASLHVSPFDSVCSCKHQALSDYRGRNPGTHYHMQNTLLIIGDKTPCMSDKMEDCDVQNVRELLLVANVRSDRTDFGSSQD